MAETAIITETVVFAVVVSLIFLFIAFGYSLMFRFPRNKETFPYEFRIRQINSKFFVIERRYKSRNWEILEKPKYLYSSLEAAETMAKRLLKAHIKIEDEMNKEKEEREYYKKYGIKKEIK